MISRYDASGSQAEFEPGSNGRVLKNKLGIKSPEAMDDAEACALERAMLVLVNEFDERHRFTASDIRKLHKTWLGGIYEWAGEYRQLNISKDGFLFAVASRVPELMAAFERDELTRYTPCNFKQKKDIARALATTHVELVLIHPFREGNGRGARMLSNLMALQSGLPLLDFSLIAGKKKNAYFAAVQVGLDKDYDPMEILFSEIIEQSLGSS